MRRVLAVFSAVMVVAAVAVATTGPRPESLGRVLGHINPAWPAAVETTVSAWFGDWALSALAQPLLRRPAWLPPASLALIAFGVVLSMTGGKTTHRSRRRS